MVKSIDFWLTRSCQFNHSCRQYMYRYLKRALTGFYRKDFLHPFMILDRFHQASLFCRSSDVVPLLVTQSFTGNPLDINFFNINHFSQMCCVHFVASIYNHFCYLMMFLQRVMICIYFENWKIFQYIKLLMQSSGYNQQILQIPRGIFFDFHEYQNHFLIPKQKDYVCTMRCTIW